MRKPTVESPMTSTRASNAAQVLNATAADVLDIENFRSLVALLPGQTMESLTALAPKNDPFRITGARQKAAEWFAEIWNRYGFTTGTHTRRVHYRLVSQPEPVIMPDGKPYRNTVECAAALNEAARDARHLDLVSAEDFVDRRNDAAYCCLEEGDGTSAEQGIANAEMNFTVDRQEMPAAPALKLTRPEIVRPYHVEIWCEKSTVDDVLRPLAEEYKLNVKTFAGAASLTACVELVERAKESGRPVRILYISDFDPAGHEMPVATAVKIQHRIARLGIGHLDIQLRPVALTPEQCQQYQLPRTPIKESDVSKAGFEARFGEGATELDALEGLLPGELRRLLVEEIERYHDPDLQDEVNRVAENVEEDLEETTEQIHDQYRDELDDLEARWDAIQDFQRRLVEHWMLRAATLYERIGQDLESAPEVEAEWPTPRDADEDTDPLFNANRGYVEQVHRFKAHQGKPVERRTMKFDPKICANPDCGREHKRKGKFCKDSCRMRAHYLNKPTDVAAAHAPNGGNAFSPNEA
jgi:hypothetical protein